MNLESTFKDKRVFITGHTGFKGSWLITWLHLLGAHIKGYALAPENDHDLYAAIHGDKLGESVIADIRNQARVKKELLAFQPDFVFHLAAQPLVLRSYAEPVYTHEVNVMGTAHVLEALRELHKPCVAVMITTDKVYLNDETGREYREDDRLGGYDPYSASKAAAEIVISSYRNSFFNPAHYKTHYKSISVARAGNVIGGGDWAMDRIIPDIVRALSSNTVVAVRNPNAVRPWQHVIEPISGYLTLADSQFKDPAAFSDAYNFGPLPQDSLEVIDLVKLSIVHWGSGEFDLLDGRKNQHEAKLLRLDIDKASKKLGWRPKLNSREAIELTLNWYKRFSEHADDAFAMMKENIEEYSQHK
jgi:CDP-glucose 4,6-dehydratase